MVYKETGKVMGMKRKDHRRKIVLFFLIVLTAFYTERVVSLGKEEEYGEIAWKYLTQMVEQYPNRIAGSDAKKQAGEWIEKEMMAMGYEIESMPFEQGGYHFVNYVATKPGYGEGTVYLGAHYDSVNTTGTDDNASGVATLMEVARRVFGEEMEYTLKFCFFDGEESLLTGIGYAGSCNYTTTRKEEASQALCYINVDCVAAGDALFAYGGMYTEDGSLIRTEGYDWANQSADELGISLKSLPQEVRSFRSPTRVTGSDQHYFNDAWQIPYVYFEATRWCEEDGSGGNEHTNQTCWYQTKDTRLASTGGCVMHMEAFDDWRVLENYFPGRIKKHLSDTTTIITHMLRNPELRFEKWTKENNTLIEEKEIFSWVLPPKRLVL